MYRPARRTIAYAAGDAPEETFADGEAIDEWSGQSAPAPGAGQSIQTPIQVSPPIQEPFVKGQDTWILVAGIRNQKSGSFAVQELSVNGTILADQAAVGAANIVAATGDQSQGARALLYKVPLAVASALQVGQGCPISFVPNQDCFTMAFSLYRALGWDYVANSLQLAAHYDPGTQAGVINPNKAAGDITAFRGLRYDALDAPLDTDPDTHYQYKAAPGGTAGLLVGAAAINTNIRFVRAASTRYKIAITLNFTKVP